MVFPMAEVEEVITLVNNSSIERTDIAGQWRPKLTGPKILDLMIPGNIITHFPEKEGEMKLSKAIKAMEKGEKEVIGSINPREPAGYLLDSEYVQARSYVPDKNKPKKWALVIPLERCSDCRSLALVVDLEEAQLLCEKKWQSDPKIEEDRKKRLKKLEYYLLGEEKVEEKRQQLTKLVNYFRKRIPFICSRIS